MNIGIEKTVGEIATECPASLRVFESLGIDYCCGGKRTLQAACDHAKLSASQVLDKLARAAQEPAPIDIDWKAAPLRALVEHIVKCHHAYVVREIPRIEMLLTKVVKRHGSTHPEIRRIQDLFSAMGQELATHLLKEERVLFPYIENLDAAFLHGSELPQSCFGSVARPVANMIADHEDAGALLAEIRTLSNSFTVPVDACPTFRALFQGLEEFECDLHQHIHLENNILFPRAIEMESWSEAAHVSR